MATKIDLTRIDISNDRIPPNFHGVKIGFLSDLHQESFGPQNVNLVRLVQKESPEYIFVTGDLIDNDVTVALELMEQLVAIAPVYFVPGNHEYYSGIYDEFKKALLKLNVCVFQNNHLYLRRGSAKVILAGVEDPVFKGNITQREHTRNSLKRLFYIKDAKFAEKISLAPEIETSLAGTDNGLYTMLLSHRPEQMDLYQTYPLDLVFSGHAHGGQVRLPWIGGVMCSCQGLIPKYDSGVYTENGTQMIVSRGLGNGHGSFRINNHPELIMVTLKHN